MKGNYHIVVQNNKLHYELNIRRNITIIRGDSATGKTRLISLLEQAADFGEGSGVEVFCERPCQTLGGRDWNLVLPNIHGQITFLDEENKFVKSQECPQPPHFCTVRTVYAQTYLNCYSKIPAKTGIFCM